MMITDFGVAVVETDSHLSKWIQEHRRLDIARDFILQFRKYIPTGGVVVDVGACLGDHTATYSELVGPDGHVFAFEPNATAFECLSHNLATARNVTCVPVGLGSLPMIAGYDSAPNLGATQLSISGLQGRTAYVDTLDSYTENWSRLDFLKADCEGWEGDVLVGAETTIRRFRPAMLIEVNRPVLDAQRKTTESIFRPLREYGYEWAPCEPGLSMDMPMVDILCLPK